MIPYQREFVDTITHKQKRKMTTAIRDSQTAGMQKWEKKIKNV